MPTTNKFAEAINGLRSKFTSGCSKNLDYRELQLRGLIRMLEENREVLADALYNDMKKPKQESYVCELDFTRNECVDIVNNFRSWAQPDYVKKNMVTLLSSTFIRKEPLGVVLVLGAWNYPVQLCICPLAGAIAAGNVAVLKPSELAPHSAQLLLDILPKYLDSECYRVVCGGVADTTELLRNRFDHIFYTGGSSVGKIIMEAASKHLTPVTLELGGKCPTYIDNDVNLKMACQRIVWGKFTNCGQTCVAPDYIMCKEDMVPRIVDQLKQTMDTFYQGTDIRQSPDYARIVNDRHYERLAKLLSGTEGKVVCGGMDKCDSKDRYIPPTIVTNLGKDDVLMKDEIFGPILPIMSVDEGIDGAIDYINSREKPLTIYMFSNNSNSISHLMESTSSGAFVSNDVVVHLSLSSLPFGGVGNSGMGSYHGKFSFDTFSHHRSCLLADRGIAESVNNLRYPPYTAKKMDWATWLLKKN